MQVNKRRSLTNRLLLLFSVVSLVQYEHCYGLAYLLAGVWQLGKKALAAIFAICPRVVFSLYLKHGAPVSGHLDASP
jgi:hypothetical protein